ncbi:MFS general substrate transporter [Agrocybe pediades]|nr:MFS general substrate transporter [Agrocybe pediades]
MQDSGYEKTCNSPKDTAASDVRKADDGFLLAEERRKSGEALLLRKLDRRVLPTVALIFIMNNIDRAAITSARLKGLEDDLHLSEIQYNVVLAMFFATYSPAQIPSNMFLNKFTRPSIYIGACVTLWGLVSLSTGTTTNFTGLMICRVCLALPEAAFYPGAMYLLSRWYTRKELALRAAIMYFGYIISSGFGNLLAAGILSGMEGKLGVRAWRWLFYIEGSITIFIGLQTMWLLPDYPHNTRWLSAAEQRLARARLAGDTGEADEDSANDSIFHGVKLALKDHKVYIFAIMNLSATLGLGFVNFIPTLTATLGFSTTITLLMAAPPWILAAVLCVINSRHADKTGERFFHLSGWWFMAITGYIIAISTMSTAGRYVSLFLLATGFLANALTPVWVSNSIPRPPSKRAASIALVNGVGNIGNLASAFVWKVEWSPQYRPSMIIGVCCLALAISLALVLRTILVRENSLLDKYEQGVQTEAMQKRIELAAQIEGISVEEALRRQRFFRYLY